TSGDYRNFITINGKSYSHIINPTTGYPVDNNVVSASVISDSCTFADGLATALMIMGQEKGIRLVNSLENIECLIVVRDENGKLTDYKSEKFPLP
ncbi:MAG: FAD:protein FMN transferase, partial [Desulfamplus sp.]|nr:FAD:protein FMN transferase [Desulfamplus sp.]